MSSAPFEMTLSVVPGDIDEQNHVNNTVYLRWVQEVATAHWEAIANSEAQKAIGWVVLRHEIDYKVPACLGDDVVLRTWVGKATRLTFERFTEIRMSSDGQLFVIRANPLVPDKLANRPASPRAGGSTRAVFDLNFVARVFHLSPARGERIKVRGSTACRRAI